MTTTTTEQKLKSMHCSIILDHTGYITAAIWGPCRGGAGREI